jgi:predicted GNAT family N-acyltransferase
MEINFKEIDFESKSWIQAVALRETVLRKPLGQTFSSDELKEESDHIHIAGFFQDEIVATCVLVKEESRIKMQRVAVLETLRNKNIGSEMMAFCEEIALSQKIDQIYCHARDSAVNFYVRNGYAHVGDFFDEDGIPHLKMVKNIS